MNAPLSLSQEVEKVIGTVVWQQVTVGHSNDTVYRLTGESTHYLKIGHDLRGEALRLYWLAQHLPVPQVHYFGESDGKQYLLMSEIPGTMLHETDLPPLKCVQLMAQGLRLFHAIPIADCPFDWSLKKQLEVAANNVRSGLLDTDLNAPLIGMTPEDAFAEMMKQIPHTAEELVVVHGDYCLPNILVDPEAEMITGFIDLGRSGVADRYTDIAVGVRSIARNLGDGWGQSFLEAYDITPNAEKMLFYSKIDKFN